EKNQLDQVFEEVKQLADKKKEIHDGDLEALISGFLHGRSGAEWELAWLKTSTATGGAASANLCLQRRSGEKLQAQVCADGAVDAVFRAIQEITGVRAQVKEYQVSSSASDDSAQSEVSLEVEHSDRTYRGQANSKDVIVGSARAFLEVVNRIAVNTAKRQA